MPKAATTRKKKPAGDPDKAKVISKEFEDFAYIVSHDLNAPLRHIREFTRLLIESHPEAANADQQEYIDFLEMSLDKICKMQEALLVFSRLNTQAGEMKPSDCNLLVSSALNYLEADIKRSGAQVNVYDMPVVNGDTKQLQALFTNLIDNAIKFHQPEQGSTVTITAGRDKDEHVFKISDTGIGIAPEYYDEIFRFFRRLNVSRFSGVGAGLPICKKIVQRHNGNIWIESALGRGTSVFFTLPA